jgi:hypothetical protein
MWQRLPRGVQALSEVGVLFLPGIPAYIWLWPNVENTDWLRPVQVLVYLYFLAGCLIIGRRRWSWDQLGLHWLLSHQHTFECGHGFVGRFWQRFLRRVMRSKAAGLNCG